MVMSSIGKYITFCVVCCRFPTCAAQISFFKVLAGISSSHADRLCMQRLQKLVYGGSCGSIPCWEYVFLSLSRFLLHMWLLYGICVVLLYEYNNNWLTKDEKKAARGSWFFSSFILLIHEGSHPGRSTRNSDPVMTASAGGAKGCSGHKFRAPPAHTAQLLTLHQHRANNQNRTVYRI